MPPDDSATQDKPSKADEPRYTVDELADRSRASFDVPPFVVVGALSDSRNKTFTLDQADKAIKAYLKHEAEVDDPADFPGAEG